MRHSFLKLDQLASTGQTLHLNADPKLYLAHICEMPRVHLMPRVESGDLQSHSTASFKKSTLQKTVHGED